MPVVTGSLTDIGLEPLAGASPLLRFTPSAPAVDGSGNVFASKPVDVQPDVSGSFSVELASTLNLLPRGTHWRLEVLFRFATADGTGYMLSDFPPLQLFLGADDISISDAVSVDPTVWASLVHVGVEPPTVLLPGLIWVDTSGAEAVIKKWEA